MKSPSSDHQAKVMETVSTHTHGSNSDVFIIKVGGVHALPSCGGCYGKSGGAASEGGFVILARSQAGITLKTFTSNTKRSKNNE